MFDLRYHVASLAAVFVALLIGILVGVGLTGKVDDAEKAELRRQIEVKDEGALEVTRMRALKIPIDPGQLDSTLSARPALVRYAGNDNLRELGGLLAQEFVTGGEAPAWDALSTHLVVNQRGPHGPRVDGVVVARTVGPQQGPTADFLTGLYEGLADAGAPAVGVELATDRTSAVQVWGRAELSTVDNIDTPPGRVALALVLAGAE